MMQSNNLSLVHVDKQFRQGDTHVLVLDKVSAIFHQSYTYAITGISGSGKSTLIQLLAGLDVPTQGSIRFNKKDLSCLSQTERDAFHNKKIGLVMQQPNLIKELSVIENVCLPGMIAQMVSSDLYIRSHELLNAVGLAHKAACKPSALSGGEQQRIALARALFNQPAFLLADEPTGNLDLQTGKKIISLLMALQREYHMGIIVSTHDHYVAESMQQQYIVQNGKLERA